MKLYATVESERAKKGQGGNKYLYIYIYGEDRENPLWLVRVVPTTSGKVAMIVSDADSGEQILARVKGEKKKGETHQMANCAGCNKEDCPMRK